MPPRISATETVPLRIKTVDLDLRSQKEQKCSYALLCTMYQQCRTIGQEGKLKKLLSLDNMRVKKAGAEAITSFFAVESIQ